MDTAAAAKTANVTAATIRTRCRRNVIAAVKVAGRWIIDTASLLHRIALTVETRVSNALSPINITYQRLARHYTDAITTYPRLITARTMPRFRPTADDVMSPEGDDHLAAMTQFANIGPFDGPALGLDHRTVRDLELLGDAARDLRRWRHSLATGGTGADLGEVVAGMIDAYENRTGQ